MEDMIIPGWAVATCSGVGSLLIAWLVWLTLKTFSNEKDISVNKANDATVQKELDKIYKALGSMEVSFKLSFERIDKKFDTFLAQEITFLKDRVGDRKR
jgi:hypothetical protein